MYCIDFKKIQNQSDDFKGKDWYKPKDNIQGIYFNKEDISMYSENAESTMEDIIRLENSKWQYLPLLYIDESVNNHMTQILYILKENFTNPDIGFTNWENFSKEDLIDLCKKQECIYINDWSNGTTFVSEFPYKIDYFLKSYCNKVM